MRKTLTKTTGNFKPPLSGLPPFAIIYGTHGIVLGYAESRPEGQMQADALNRQAPQYRHRVVPIEEVSGDGEQGSAPLPSVRRGTR